MLKRNLGIVKWVKILVKCYMVSVYEWCMLCLIINLKFLYLKSNVFKKNVYREENRRI